MGLQMLINNILNKVILEKWSPKNKKKHSACKAKVKARVKDWPSAYASGQVVQCYYNEEIEMESLKKLFERSMTSDEMKEEKKLHKKIPKKPFIDQYGEDKGEGVYYATTKKMAMESTDCGCDKKALIMEALKKKKPLSKIGGKRKPKGKTGQIGSPWFRHKQTGAIIGRHAKEGRRYMTAGEKTDVPSIAAGIDIKGSPDPSQPAKNNQEIKFATAVKIAAAKHGNPVGGSSLSSRKPKKKASKKLSKSQRDESIRSAMARIAAQRKGR